MGKLSVIIYIAVALLLLFLVSRSPRSPSAHGRSHLRLKLRSNFTFKAPAHHHHHEPVPFDPLVAELERHREDKQWEREYFENAHPEVVHAAEHAPGEESQPEWEDFMDAEDYLNDEERFNVTNRLVLLFPKIDVDPADGFVTEHELTEWNLQQAQSEVMHRTQREMELHDKNRDGYVSFAEYEPPSWVHSSDNDSFAFNMGWWKGEHFNASDADGDGLLNITEFNDFLHPADSKNSKLLQWLCKEEVRERDSDKDGKVNFNEFFRGLFDLVRNYDEESHNSSHNSDDSMEAPARVLFNQLDKDGDGYLTDVELLPVIGKLHPSERYYAKQQANYILSQADNDKDGRLTLTEMIDSPYVFYSAVFNDDEDEYDYHDEFR
ncbi:calumenin-B [Rhodamnia argentea]|uniref:Calumenin-B n=1 Tax=Rhodamnia argentea TaxID=178133 RepID=A0A8B8NJF4_9MYRT|nr:calumenin-B [Rhodamnia argentea]XP_048139680.1 calumenin-B [Rhodamnia argentea]